MRWNSAFTEGLRLEPAQGRAGAIRAVHVLRDDALEAHGVGRGEHLRAGAGHVAAEGELRQVSRADKVLEQSPALVQRLVAQVAAIEHRQVEGEEGQALGLLGEGCPHGVEVGPAVRVLHDHLAIDDGRPAGELRRGRDDRQVALRPVMAVAREGAR